MKTKILIGDCIEQMRGLDGGYVHCCITSPPYYGLRDYGCPGQIGLEQTPEEYVQKMVEVFREVKRVLRDDGVCFCNLGDSYNGSGGAGGDYGVGGLKEGQPKYPGRKISTLKPKDLIGIPWRVAFALQADGWYLRQDIIWHKPNPMPESVTDRCTKAHEYVFLLTKSARYWYDAEAIREGNANPNRTNYAPGGEAYKPGNVHDTSGRARRNDGFQAYAEGKLCNGRNKRSVWTVSTTPYKNAHFATFPPKLIEPMILAGCPAKCCQVCGAGWVRNIEKQSRYTKRQDRDAPSWKGPQVDSSGWQCPIINDKGFQPSCQCNAPDHVPGTVLDPFGGSGTTAYVANAYGRNAILCELNPEYESLIRERLGMAYEVEQEERKTEQLELFNA